MGRPAPRPAPRAPGAEQTELFPDPVHVEELDPRRVAGDHTRIRALYRVRIGHGGDVHLVFHDRHGIYCEIHGPVCPAVAALGIR